MKNAIKDRKTQNSEQLFSLAQANVRFPAFKHIISFSGGKDSTALLLMMLEKKMRIDEIIFCDTGKEFPQIYKHIEKVSEYIGQQITTIKSHKSFEYWLGEHYRKRRNGTIQIGYGWPDFQCRWCTGALKRDVLKKYLRGIEYILYQGIAFDETERIKRNKDGRNFCYPLVEWGITENQALRYCYKRGFNWGGMYRKFKRVSCYCCPLKRISELYVIYKEYPELWNDIRKMDKLSFRQFRSDYSLDELGKKFKLKARQFEIIK